MQNSTLYHEALIRERVTVPENGACDRLDRYASENFRTLPSRKSAFKAIKRGDLLVNGEAVQPNQAVRENDDIILLDSLKKTPQCHLTLDVVWEDNWLAVVRKPAGIPVNGCYRLTVENALSSNLSSSKADDVLGWPRPVHRLDLQTSGLLLVAKSAKCLMDLGRQFQRRRINKRYRSIVTGHLEGQGTLVDSINGKNAKTFYCAVEHTRSLRTNWITTVDLFPITGRTHQLRRHMHDIGHSVVGDRLYGEKNKIFHGKGLFLCSVELAFYHPISMKRITLTINEPSKFQTYREREERRWKKYNE